MRACRQMQSNLPSMGTGPSCHRFEVARTIFMLLAALLWIMPGGSARAAYCPPGPRTLAEQSDLIVTGTVVGLTGKTYDLEIAGAYKGHPKSRTVTVVRFRDWACARRPWPYSSGQKLVLFLNAGRSGSSCPADAYQAIGGGAEGEMLIRNDRIEGRCLSASPMTWSEFQDRLTSASPTLDLHPLELSVHDDQTTHQAIAKERPPGRIGAIIDQLELADVIVAATITASDEEKIVCNINQVFKGTTYLTSTIVMRGRNAIGMLEPFDVRPGLPIGLFLRLGPDCSLASGRTTDTLCVCHANPGRESQRIPTYRLRNALARQNSSFTTGIACQVSGSSHCGHFTEYGNICALYADGVSVSDTRADLYDALQRYTSMSALALSELKLAAPKNLREWKAVKRRIQDLSQFRSYCDQSEAHACIGDGIIDKIDCAYETYALYGRVAPECMPSVFYEALPESMKGAGGKLPSYNDEVVTAVTAQGGGISVRYAGDVYLAAVSPDCRRVAVSLETGDRHISSGGLLRSMPAVAVFETSGMKLLRVLPHAACSRALVFSPDGRYLAGNAENSVTVWNAETYAVEFQIRHGAMVGPVDFSADGRYIFSGADDGRIIAFDVNARKVSQVWTAHYGAVLGLAASPDGRTLYTGGADGRLKAFDTRSGTLTKEVLPCDGKEQISAVVISASGRTLGVIAGYDGPLVYRLPELEATSMHVMLPTCLCFPMSGEFCVAGNVRGDVQMSSGLLPCHHHEDVVRDVTFSADGKSLLTCCADRTLKIMPLTSIWPGL